MRLWRIETGGTREQFWACTPREAEQDIEIADVRMRRDEQVRRWHTWHAAALTNAKKFPDFKDFVPIDAPAAKPKAPQTWQEQLAVARQWAAVS